LSANPIDLTANSIQTHHQSLMLSTITVYLESTERGIGHFSYR